MRNVKRRGLRRAHHRRGIALVDAIVGGLMLGIGLTVVVSMASRALARQTDGEKRMVASWLADEMLNMVLAEGPEKYEVSHDTADRFGDPFADFSYEINIDLLGRGAPYRVTATVTWPVGRTTHFVRVETLIAARLGDPVQLREPYEPLDRDARNFGDDAGTGLGGGTAGGGTLGN
jgi:hypothetical protein